MISLELISSIMGPEKMASLNAVSLHDIVRVKMAQECGIETGVITLTDAAAALGKVAFERRNAYRTINHGLGALGALLPQEKVASEKPRLAIPSHLFQKIALAYSLEKYAALANEADKALLHEYRNEVIDRTYEQLYKEAGVLDAVKSSGAAKALGSAMKSDTAKNVGKGMAVGTGLAVPGVAAGSYLSDKATDDARDKALQVAAGTAALGVGAYGIGKGMDRFAERTASGESVLEDLETTYYVDAMLAQRPTSEKVASLRRINRDYGMTLLYRVLQ